jgi:hypothetical protein
MGHPIATDPVWRRHSRLAKAALWRDPAWPDRFMTVRGQQTLSTATLSPFGPEIWTTGGPTVYVAGFAYPTRMAVVRLSDGGLLVWSPVALTEPVRTEVLALGEVRVLIAPNSLHHLFLAEWRAAFPSAKLHAAPGFHRRCPDIAVDADLADAAPPEWAADLEQVVVPGNAITTEVVFFHRTSRTVLFTDLIQQFDPGWFSGWRAIVARLDRLVGTEAAVPQKFRLAFTDRRAARVAIRRILAWPAERVLMAHGAPVMAEGQAFIRRAFGWLKA